MSLALVACGSTCATETPTPEPGAPLAPVGNNDPRGIDNQPDWEAMARELRVEMDARLPRPLPSDLRLACNEMLDAAARFYADTEPNPAQKVERAEELAGTRAAELAACVASSSIEAAICVRLRLDDRDSEYPWLLDQCSRAYPHRRRGLGDRARAGQTCFGDRIRWRGCWGCPDSFALSLGDARDTAPAIIADEPATTHDFTGVVRTPVYLVVCGELFS